MSESTQNRTKNIIIALLVLAVIIVGYLLTKTSGEVDNLTAEKDNLITELEQIRSELKATKSDNDSMALYITAETERLGVLIAELEGKNDATEADLDKWRKQVQRSNNEKKKLISQVDSINKAYKALQIEKEQVEEVLEGEVVKNTELTSENRELNKNVAVGSMLQLSKMEAAAYKLKGSGKEKESNTASADRFKACYTIAKNLIAKGGERTVYMRITTPELKVLASKDGENTFNFNGQPLMYSAKQNMFYENDIIESCINFDKANNFVAGEYTIELFTEGYRLGEAKVTLK
jgi:outer membrane murein-binding lipoprotein Lpp